MFACVGFDCPEESLQKIGSLLGGLEFTLSDDGKKESGAVVFRHEKGRLCILIQTTKSSGFHVAHIHEVKEG